MKKILLLIILVIPFVNIKTQVPFNLNPDWISTDISSVSTGGAFADIDQDGWLDFVVANGNDMARQKVVVYYNDGNGNFPLTPNWQSSDIDYHGHLDVGDVNADGYPDVAVSVYLGPNGFNDPGKVKLYLNNAGTLSSNPDWVSGDNVFTFSCAFGDADGDGDLDLAVAGGESYYSDPEQPRIYYNNNGTLESLPSWKATNAQYSYDVNWADFDNDGDLDVVFNGESYPNRIFENFGDSISITPTWQSTDASQYANSLFVGDVNNDGYLDLAISDNNQLGGEGRFKIYLNNNGDLNTTPFWTSSVPRQNSGINLVDIDNDNNLDLITGGWWEPVRIYINNSGTFTTTPQYTSTSTSVVEVIVMSDIDKDAVQDIQESFVSDGIKKLFYLPRTPLQEIKRVIVNSDTLQFNQYCYDLENGWLMLASQPDSGLLVNIEAAVSWDIDMGITNWDNSKGNYLFYNTSNPVSASGEEKLPEGFFLYQNYPNPFNPTTKIKFTIPTLPDRQAGSPFNPSPYQGEGNRERLITLKVYDVLGNEVATLVDGEKSAGEYEVEFYVGTSRDLSLPSGVYFYQLKTEGFVKTKKMLMIK